jgi:hypothetical protein
MHQRDHRQICILLGPRPSRKIPRNKFLPNTPSIKTKIARLRYLKYAIEADELMFSTVFISEFPRGSKKRDKRRLAILHIRWFWSVKCHALQRIEQDIRFLSAQL